MNDNFAVSRKQLHRMNRIVALLKQEQNVTQKRMLEVLAETEFASSGPILTCGEKTLQRDLRILREEFDCPLEWAASRVYVLGSRYWTLPIPAVLNEEELFAIVLGGKMAVDMLPPVVAEKITSAVNAVVVCNSIGDNVPELVSRLKILAGTATEIHARTFLTVFEAWRTRRLLSISYCDWKGNITERVVEPQVLIFHEMQWSIKGLCHLRNRNRSFYLQRMQSVRMQDEHFRADNDLVNSITLDTVFFRERMSGIVIRLTEKGRQFAGTHVLHSEQTFRRNDDGTYLMTIPDGAVELVIPWILRQAGEAAIVSPPEMVIRVREAVARLMKTCGMS